MTDAAYIPSFPLADEFGNINLHAAGGQVFGVQLLDPVTMQPTNISALTYVFKIEDIAVITLAAGADNMTKTLTIPDGLFGIPLGTSPQWALLDTTGEPGQPTQTLRSGVLNVYGFR
jgi:hypothetical protein